MASSQHHLALENLRGQMAVVFPGWDIELDTRLGITGLQVTVTFSGIPRSFQALMDVRPLVWAPESVRPMLVLWRGWAEAVLEALEQDEEGGS